MQIPSFEPGRSSLPLNPARPITIVQQIACAAMHGTMSNAVTMFSTVMLTTCATVICLYHGVSSMGIAFMVGDKSAGSENGFDLLSGPKGLATFFAGF